jgi:hypothetical protein
MAHEQGDDREDVLILDIEAGLADVAEHPGHGVVVGHDHVGGVAEADVGAGAGGQALGRQVLEVPADDLSHLVEGEARSRLGPQPVTDRLDGLVQIEDRGDRRVPEPERLGSDERGGDREDDQRAEDDEDVGQMPILCASSSRW